MIGLMSSTGLGLVTEIKDPRQLLLPDVNESLLRQIVNVRIIMVSRAHNMSKSGLDPIDCKSSWI